MLRKEREQRASQAAARILIYARLEQEAQQFRAQRDRWMQAGSTGLLPGRQTMALTARPGEFSAAVAARLREIEEQLSRVEDLVTSAERHYASADRAIGSVEERLARIAEIITQLRTEELDEHTH